MDQSGCLGEVGEDSLITIDVPLLDAISWWLQKKMSYIQRLNFYQAIYQTIVLTHTASI